MEKQMNSFARAIARVTCVAILGSMAMAASAAWAAEEIGRITLDGRTVILKSDNSWEYASDAPLLSADCTVVRSETVPVSLCLDERKWSFANIAGDAEIKLKLKDSELYLLVITERAVIDISALKRAAISNAQQVSGLTKVETLVDGSAIFDAHGFGEIQYKTNVDGLDITYANYNTSFEGKGSLQLVFFSASELFGGFKPEIDAVLAGLSVED